MYQLEDQLVLSPSDLNNFLQCRHLTALDLAYARGEIGEKPERDPQSELVARKGDEHEAAYLQSLKDAGRQVVEIELRDEADPARRAEALREAAAATEQAMRDGAEVIFQGTFFQLPYRGHTDFLFRVERPSDLGEHSYEVADTKLARRAKPYFLLQLCFYSELVEAIQGTAPQNVRVILGSGEEHSFRLAEFSAYFRHMRDRFRRQLDDGGDGGGDETYPHPVDHCAVCTWSERCDAQRVADDHLSLVANIRRSQTDGLTAAGISTLAALGQAGPGARPDGINAEVFTRLADQAALQLAARRSGEHSLHLLPPEPARGFSRLPPPSPGDVFFDMEGDPFFQNGLEYLFGAITVQDGVPEFTAFWGRDRAEEKVAFERFIDFVVQRRARHPDLHIYHYASYELTALKRLAGQHGTREAELDDLLRNNVFVDLFKIVREGMRISQPSYSIKKVEAFYMEQRDTAVTDGGDSIVKFEEWLATREPELLTQIAAYNEDDCLSTWKLREWLLEQRAAAEAQFGTQITWSLAEEEPSEPDDRDPEDVALIDALLDGVPDDLDLAQADEAQRARWLAAQLLEYHQREARPVWWMFFERLDAEMPGLIDDADCIGGLEPDPATPSRPEKRSTVYRLLFPPQETKMGVGDDTHDPVTWNAAGKIVAIDRVAGWVELKRGPKLAGVDLPRALIPGGPYRTPEQRAALRRLAADIVAGGLEADGRYPALRQILLRQPPRVAGRERGAALQDGSIELAQMMEIVAALDGSYLFIQGPPGAGKTHNGARLIVDLIGRGKRVGVASQSHKSIGTLLEKVEEVAVNEGVDFRGLKKMSKGDSNTAFESKIGSELIGNTADNSALTSPTVALAAGTAWHFCREEVDEAPAKLDYLFIDEAGQVSLADALAMGTAAHNIVLLGDPQQLPQVAQGAHPQGAAMSVLEHLLGDHQTIPPDRGLFLDKTWRMHPDVCAFVSEVMYEGRLGSMPHTENQVLGGDGEWSGAGLRWLPVEHEANAQASPEEAEAIAAAIGELLGRDYTDADGATRPLTEDDILVVTPYNAQVKCLEATLPPGVRAGTVDKFQGQESPVVFFSMATSSAEELPRNLEFLFSRNRLNVAISRAQCTAILVCSPHLLEVSCRTVEQMRLVNALCRLAEYAELSDHGGSPI